MNKSFLWGGAVAANQYEGGYQEGHKGLSVTDVMSAGDVDHPREISYEILDDKYYPNHYGIDFIIIIKKILNYLLKWALNVSV